MMFTKYNSKFIFELITEFEIFTESGKDNVFTDEAYTSFCKKYVERSEIRDVELRQYLNSSSSLFRCHLPFSKWAYGVACSIVWYYDEIIVEDPVLLHINKGYRDLEFAKDQLKQVLIFLKSNREAIEGGYIGNSAQIDPT